MRNIIHQYNEWKDPQGQMITMCVIEEICPDKTFSAPAIAVVGGLSVCRNHLHKVSASLIDGASIENILYQASSGAY